MRIKINHRKCLYAIILQQLIHMTGTMLFSYTEYDTDTEISLTSDLFKIIKKLIVRVDDTEILSSENINLAVAAKNLIRV